MNGKVNAFAIAALCAAFTASHADALSITNGNEVTRSSEGIELSGITWAGGNTYYAVNDTNASNRLYKITFSVNSSGQVSSYNNVSSVTLASSSDLEGCAYDPASGNVWVSMEGNNSSIREYNPETGAWLRTAPLPVIYKNNMRGNFKLEALTISGDGLTMWTANEEALTCDGGISAKPRDTGGTTVRLLKLTRASVRDNWTPAAQYAYKTYGLNYAYGYNNAQRSGVAGLCALPNGQLLVLEREFSGTDDNSNLSSIWVGMDSSFTMAIVLADYSSASDVSTLPSLSQSTYTPVTKTKLFEKDTGYANYEGICLGPRISNDTVSLLLISDGGGNSMVKKTVMSKKLTGIDVRTLYIEGAANSEPIGGPYRHVGGTTVSASLSGAGNPYEANLCVHPSWTATANNAQGDGSYASFAIAADDTLRWSTTTNTSLPLLAADSFERIPVATEADGLDGWNGEGWVVATNYTPALPPGYPLTNEVHTQVLMVDGDVERTYDTSIAKGVVLDTMVCATLPSVDSPIVDVEDGVVAFHFDEDGYPILQHGSADGLTHMRTRLSNQRFANGNWLRLTLTLSNVGTQTWCQVRINGSTCVSANAYRSPADTAMVGTYGSWFRAIADKDPAEISSLLLKGTGAVDDVALYTASGLPEFDNNGNATTNSVSYQWLYDNGLPFDTELDVDGDGFESSQEWRNGTNPTDPWNKSDNPRSRKITVFTIQ